LRLGMRSTYMASLNHGVSAMSRTSLLLHGYKIPRKRLSDSASITYTLKTPTNFRLGRLSPVFHVFFIFAAAFVQVDPGRRWGGGAQFARRVPVLVGVGSTNPLAGSEPPGRFSCSGGLEAAA
jgi:hypothetical protein